MRESELYDYNWKTVMTETAQSTKYEKNFRIQDIGISPFEVQANKDHCLFFLSCLQCHSMDYLIFACLFSLKIKLIVYGRHDEARVLSLSQQLRGLN